MTNSYNATSKFLHWSIFILVFVMILLGYFREDISFKPLPLEVMSVHKLLGLLILALMLFRLFWMSTHPKPPSLPGTPLWQRWSERVVHFLLYFFLIVMPLSGWLMSSAAGRPPHLFFDMRLPIAKNKELAEFFVTVHNTLAIVIIALISIHILAALYHHFIKKDEVLRRMLPYTQSR